MSANVIDLAQHFKPKATPVGNLIKSFAHHRRHQNDVYWLKENAELLNILECSDVKVSSDDLEIYSAFYQNLPDRLAFFPQYYRFLISVALDLEDLGMPGQIAEQLCAFVAQQGLARGELSDLQRAEAVRMLARRGAAPLSGTALAARLHDFMGQSTCFALPNRKLAYELTHVVFYLSEYGRKDPNLSEAAIQSLMFTGILAHLEENADLLSEVCIALRYAGQTPPRIWEDMISDALAQFEAQACDTLPSVDQYHAFFVSNWACAQGGGRPFVGSFDPGRQMFLNTLEPKGVLRALSQAMFEQPVTGRSSWATMGAGLMSGLPEHMNEHLKKTMASTSEFEAFFAHFARSNSPETTCLTAQHSNHFGGVG